MAEIEFLHPANVEELANFTVDTGAEVLRGPLHYPSHSGGWQLGECLRCKAVCWGCGQWTEGKASEGSGMVLAARLRQSEAREDLR